MNIMQICYSNWLSNIFVLQTWLTALLDLTHDECHNIYTEIVQGCLEEESFIKGNISALIPTLNLMQLQVQFQVIITSNFYTEHFYRKKVSSPVTEAQELFSKPMRFQQTLLI